MSVKHIYFVRTIDPKLPNTFIETEGFDEDEHDDYHIPEGSYLATASYIIAIDQLDFFNRDIVLINTSVEYSHTGNLIKYSAHRNNVYAWKDFRLTGVESEIIKEMPVELKMFYEYLTFNTNTFQYIGVDEFQKICSKVGMHQARRTFLNAKGTRVSALVAENHSCIGYAITDTTCSITPVWFLFACYDKSMALTRVNFSNLFEDCQVPDEITSLSISLSRVSKEVMVEYHGINIHDGIFIAKPLPFGIPVSHIDAMKYLKGVDLKMLV